MKIKKMRFNQKLLFEFISVSFAVFLGLMLNQWKDNHVHKKLAEQSLKNFRDEITDNTALVQNMLDSHKVLITKVDSLLTRFDNTDKNVDEEVELNFQLLSSTSWETAKLTQAIAYMKINMVSDIAGVYDFQDYYGNLVNEYIKNNIYINPEENKRKSLENIRSLLNAIIPIENDLLEYYKYLQTEIPVSN